MLGVLYLAPQSPDVDVHRPVAAVVIVAPHPVKQSIPGIHAAFVDRQEPEQFVLPEGKFHHPVADGYLTAGGVYHQVIPLDKIGLVVGSLQQPPYPQHHLIHPTRLESEIVHHLQVTRQVRQGILSHQGDNGQGFTAFYRLD